MRYTQVNLNGQLFRMPAITLGSTWFGTKIGEADAFSMLDYYRERGGNWLDTARVYGVGLIEPRLRQKDMRDSEEAIGRWLALRGCRGSMTVITKGAHWSLENRMLRVQPQAIREDMEESLRTLNLDNVDIYLLHNDDPEVPVSQVMPALDKLVRQGLTRAVGASNWSSRRVREANAFATANGLTPFSIVENRWSYAHQPQREPRHIDFGCEPGQYRETARMGLPLMAYSSQAKGFFQKALLPGTTRETMGKAGDLWSEENLRRAKAVEQACGQEGISISAAAFAYLWSREVPVTAIVGCSRLEQLQATMEDCGYQPSPQAVKILEEAYGN